MTENIAELGNEGQDEIVKNNPRTADSETHPTPISDTVPVNSDPTINTGALAREVALAAIPPVQYDTKISSTPSSEKKGLGKLLHKLFGQSEKSSNSKSESGPSSNLAQVEEDLIRDIESGTPVVISGSHPDELRFVCDRAVAKILHPSEPSEIHFTPSRVDCRKLSDDQPSIIASIAEMVNKGSTYIDEALTSVSLELGVNDRFVLFMEHLEEIDGETRGKIMSNLRWAFVSRASNPEMKKIVVIATIEVGENLVPDINITPYNIGREYTLK